jgi:RHS repeat-associated protein
MISKNSTGLTLGNYSIPGSSADELRKGYTGYEKDSESGLDFAEARYYNATHGRYTSVDPLTASVETKDPQTFNRYSYVLNSPYKFIDPLGLLPVSATTKCNFQCRVMDAINNGGKLSEADYALAAFHIQNGTALAYAFLNASYAAIGRQNANQSPATAQQNEGTNYPANPNAPVPGSTYFEAPTFAELTQLKEDSNPGATAALQILENTRNAESIYNNFTVYQRAAFVNTIAAIADAKLSLDGVKHEGFYTGGKKSNAFGVILSGVTKENLDGHGLGKSGFLGLGGRRSPGDIKFASLEASRLKGRPGNRVAFDVDLYNPKSGIKNFIKHLGEVGFNSRNGFTTQPADVARALTARGVISGVRTR